MENISLEIDGKSVEAPRGTTILKAAKAAGITIPTLCHSDKLESYGACRMCMVEIQKNGRKKLVASCSYPVEEGLRVRTNTEKVNGIRRMIVELLWPATQMYAKDYGITTSRFKPAMTDCILCGLCVRYCAEVKKNNMIYFKGRGIDRKPVSLDESKLACSSCGECFPLCPSGWIVTQN
jgi:bidirectional [NiFe] hydrogenase diaphorase subunit